MDLCVFARLCVQGRGEDVGSGACNWSGNGVIIARD